MSRLMSTLWGKILIGIVGLLVVCCVFGAMVGPRESSAPSAPGAAASAPTASAAEAAAAPEATEADQARPTAAPEATAVPTEPPLPTKAPEPTKPTIDPAVVTYAQTVAEKFGTLSTALTDLGALLQNAKPADQNWMIDTAVQVTTIRQVHTDVKQMDVPPSMQELHAKVLDATEDCDTSMVFLTRGIDSGNKSDLEEALRYINQCGAKIKVAGDAAQSYTP